MGKVAELQLLTKDKDGEVELIKGGEHEDESELVMLLQFTCADDTNDAAESLEDTRCGG